MRAAPEEILSAEAALRVRRRISEEFEDLERYQTVEVGDARMRLEYLGDPDWEIDGPEIVATRPAELTVRIARMDDASASATGVAIARVNIEDWTSSGRFVSDP